jgi:hypothetical protein
MTRLFILPFSPTEDIQHILEHLHRAQLRIRIDMEEADL